MAPGPDPHEEAVYYGDGTLKMKGTYVDGEMHGDWEWYRLDGSLMRSGQFDRGKQTGAWRTFDPIRPDGQGDGLHASRLTDPETVAALTRSSNPAG